MTSGCAARDLNPRTRGLRARFILLYEVSAYAGEYRVFPVRARHCDKPCRIVPGADGPYHGMRANNEQTSLDGVACVQAKVNPAHEGPGGYVIRL